MHFCICEHLVVLADGDQRPAGSRIFVIDVCNAAASGKRRVFDPLYRLRNGQLRASRARYLDQNTAVSIVQCAVQCFERTILRRNSDLSEGRAFRKCIVSKRGQPCADRHALQIRAVPESTTLNRLHRISDHNSPWRIGHLSAAASRFDREEAARNGSDAVLDINRVYFLVTGRLIGSIKLIPKVISGSVLHQFERA